MADEPKPGDHAADPPSAAAPDAPKPAATPDAPTSAVPKPATAAAPAPRPKPKPKAPPEAPTGPIDPPPPDDLERPPFLAALQKILPEAVEQISYWVGDWTVIVQPTSLLDVARFLKESDEGSFDYCSDVTASDWPPREKRFDVIYCLYSTRRRHRVRIPDRFATATTTTDHTDTDDETSMHELHWFTPVGKWYGYICICKPTPTWTSSIRTAL